MMGCTRTSARKTTRGRFFQRTPSLSLHITFLLISVLITFSPLLIHSQTTYFSPDVVSGPGFARSIKSLYVTGGVRYVPRAGFTVTWQSISLDLTTPWNATAPAWKEFAHGPLQTSFPAALSSDEQTLYAFNIEQSNSPLQYNVQNDTWQESPVKFQKTGFYGISAVTDPRTGLIYLAGGYDEGNYNAPFYKYLDIFDPATQTIRTVDLPDPANFFPVRRYYGNVWSDHRKSIVYWGGLNQSVLDPGVVPNGVTEFSPDSKEWSTMKTQGPTPRLRRSHCMAANEDGTKLAIYGGEYINNISTVVGELWVLDLVTSTWTQGPTGQPRIQAVCTIAGDQFLIWGGSVNYTTIAPPEMLIYNLSASTYIKQYTPPLFYKDLKLPPSLTNTTASGDANSLTPNNNRGHVRVAVGGTLGGLVLMGIIAGVIFFRRRQRRSRDKEQVGSKVKRISQPRRYAGLIQWWKGRREGEVEVLEKTLRALEEEQQELDKQRQILEEKHQQETNQQTSLTQKKRGPTVFLDDKAELFPLPPPQQLGSNAMTSISYSREDLKSRRTVQGVYGPVGLYPGGDGDTDDGLRTESDLAQDLIEPMYEPSPEINGAIPDLVYIPPPNVGMDWTKQQQKNHPHAMVDPFNTPE